MRVSLVTTSTTLRASTGGDERGRDGRRERHGGPHRPADVEDVELEPRTSANAIALRPDDLHEETDDEPDGDEADADGEPGAEALGEPLPQGEAEAAS